MTLIRKPGPKEGVPLCCPAAGEGRNADRRFVWNMMALYTPYVDQLNAICRGEQTPQGAADAINAVWEAELAK